jgi:hypothetical protein
MRVHVGMRRVDVWQSRCTRSRVGTLLRTCSLPGWPEISHTSLSTVTLLIFKVSENKTVFFTASLRDGLGSNSLFTTLLVLDI